MPKYKISVDDQRFIGFLDRLLRMFPDQKVMNELGLTAVRMLKKRTRRGRDVEGDRFARYNPQYAKRKRKETGRPTGTPDLIYNDIDGMMEHVDYLVARNFRKLTVYIKGSRNRRIARYHNTFGAGKSRVIRKFMGYTDREVKILTNLVNIEVKPLLIKLMKG